MGNLFIEISQTNDTMHYCIYDNQFEETAYSKKGELYQALVKEYGKCISKQYIDVDGKPVQVGWVFEKRIKYDDVRSSKSFKYMNSVDLDRCSFICHTWISVHTERPTVKTTMHFAKF